MINCSSEICHHWQKKIIICNTTAVVQLLLVQILPWMCKFMAKCFFPRFFFLLASGRICLLGSKIANGLCVGLFVTTCSSQSRHNSVVMADLFELLQHHCRVTGIFSFSLPLPPHRVTLFRKGNRSSQRGTVGFLHLMEKRRQTEANWNETRKRRRRK